MKAIKVILTHVTLLFIAAFLMQGFQCASSEMTTAKVAINAKDWEKAENFLQKELNKNPTNGEAWYNLGVVRKERNNLPGMVEAFKEAKKYVTDKTLLDNIGILEFQAWADSYNKGINLYSSGTTLQDPSEKNRVLREALTAMEFAKNVKPGNTEIYGPISYIYEALGDTAQSIHVLEEYTDTQKESVDLLMSKNLTLNMKHEDAVKSLGAPSDSRRVAFGEGGKDSAIIDVYKSLDGKEAYFFYALKDKQYGLSGLRVNPGKELLTVEKERYVSFDSRTYLVLAYHYYDKKNYDKANQYLTVYNRLVPGDEQAMQLQSQILQETGKQGEALRSVEELTKKYPDNKAYLVQYGSLLAAGKNYDAAITQFEKALALDPKYDVALYNAGAAYKNKAGIIQQEEKAKVDANPKYQDDLSRYKPFLMKSSEYFERYRQIPGKDTDFNVIEQLVNNYQVMDNKEKLKAFMGELEGSEPLYKDNAQYYLTMGKLYATMGKTDKAKQFYEKADKLRGK